MGDASEPLPIEQAAFPFEEGGGVRSNLIVQQDIPMKSSRGGQSAIIPLKGKRSSEKCVIEIEAHNSIQLTEGTKIPGRLQIMSQETTLQLEINGTGMTSVLFRAPGLSVEGKCSAMGPGMNGGDVSDQEWLIKEMERYFLLH